jgi:hypothetical protein
MLKTGTAFVRRGAVIGVVSLMLQGTAYAAPDLSNVLGILDGMQDGGWAKISLNRFSEAWPDRADRPFSNSLYGSTNSLIPAWSGFTWDSNRAELLLFGGGHANYAGNEVYRWSAVTQRWERGSMPSDVILDSGTYTAKDGALNAPLSAHTYDNTNYLPVADRMLLLGGAVFNTSSNFRIPDGNGGNVGTGPYVWDPAKANANQVGGTTGSAVNPAIVGGQMWQNRQLSGFGDLSVVSGTSATAIENGHDVVYFTASSGGSTNKNLFRYSLVDLNDPSKDTLERVGIFWGGTDATGAAGYDPDSRLYVALGAQPGTLNVWDIDSAGPDNRNRMITPTILGDGTFTGGPFWGIDWHPDSGTFLLWSGGGDVWSLAAPEAGTVDGIWNMSRITTASFLSAAQLPPPEIQNGVWGKWKYIPNLNAFMALEDGDNGNVWVYRPENWSNPVPIPEPLTIQLLLCGLGFLTLTQRWRAGRSKV